MPTYINENPNNQENVYTTCIFTLISYTVRTLAHLTAIIETQNAIIEEIHENHKKYIDEINNQ
jgi:hypothetical protein